MLSCSDKIETRIFNCQYCDAPTTIGEEALGCCTKCYTGKFLDCVNCGDNITRFEFETEHRTRKDLCHPCKRLYLLGVLWDDILPEYKYNK